MERSQFIGKTLSYPVYSFVQEDEGVSYIDGVNFYRHYQGSDRDPQAKPWIITQPLGNVWVGVDAAVGMLKIPTTTALSAVWEDGKPSLRPPGVTNRTINLGAASSPEFVCYPYKQILGYFKERAIEFEGLRKQYGPNFYPVFLGHRSLGSCKERAYNILHEAAMHDFYKEQFGHSNFDFYVVSESAEGLKGLVGFFMGLVEKNKKESVLEKTGNCIKVIRAINEGVRRFGLAETLEDATRYVQCLVARDFYQPGEYFYEAERILDEYRIKLASPNLPSGKVRSTASDFYNQIDDLKIRADKAARTAGLKVRSEPKAVIAVTGEVYCVAAMDTDWRIGQELARRGFYYKTTGGPGEYAHKFSLSPLDLAKRASEQKLQSLAKEFLGIDETDAKYAALANLTYDMGGHSKETVATVQRAELGILPVDAVMVLEPTDCGPQIGAASVLSRQKPKNIAYYRFILGEQGGIDGFRTRLEQFLELAEERANRR